MLGLPKSSLLVAFVATTLLVVGNESVFGANIVESANRDDDLKTFKFEMESMAYGDAYANSESEDEFRFGGARANVDLIKQTLEELRAARNDVLNFAIYYESLCPDSRRLIINGLQAAYLYAKDITNIILIPYGKANFTWVEANSTWFFQCQHGPNECLGNVIHNCMIYYYPAFEDHYPFINCSMETFSGDLVERYRQCALKYYDQSVWDRVLRCTDGPLGNQLFYGSGMLTESLIPLRNYVPWINLNGLHSSEIQDKAEKDFLQFTCLEYKGPNSPPICQQYFGSAVSSKINSLVLGVLLLIAVQFLL